MALSHPWIVSSKEDNQERKCLGPTVYSLLPSAYSKGPSELKVGDVIIEIDPRYFRPTEVESLLGDASKAKVKLGWEPKVRFNELVQMMVNSDIKELEELRRCQDVIRKLSNSKQ